jgi:hypothetical protein
MRRQLFGSGGDKSAAVAPTVALSLFALIGAGGIAFDYSRMASLDTELQNAADQAALAGATQLDGEARAIERATAAAQGLLENQTLMANDGTGAGVSIPVVEFYETKDDAENDTNGFTDISRFADAHFVRVEVAARRANFALTPIVGAFTSGDLGAEAVAGLGQAICKTPPVMMCNPAEPDGNSNLDYPFDYPAGVGIRLVVGGPDAPGNFGFLQTGYGTGAQALAKAIGYNTPPANCLPTDGVDTEPGDKESVRAAFNTRFDLSEAGQTCPGGDANCSPSVNSRKDLVKGNNCGTSGNQGWQEAPNPYRPTSPTVPLDGTNDPDIMGHPRDMCHAVSVDGECGGTGIIGDGVWDRDAYFRVNYGWDHDTWVGQPGLTANATRYEVYEWELDNPSAGYNDSAQPVGSLNGYAYPFCRTPGIVPSTTIPDRRRISVAVVNCDAQGLAGREYGVGVLKWYDIFLVEPAFARGNGPSARTTNGDIYVELIGETQVGTGPIRRDVPYLVK